MSKFIAGGCSFTLGNELSDDIDGKTPSKMTWAHGLKANLGDEYVNKIHIIEELNWDVKNYKRDITMIMITMVNQ